MSSYTGPTPGTNLGPLTTTWTPPAACNVAIVACPSSCHFGFQGQQCDGDIGGAGCKDATTCWPTATVTRTDPSLYGFGYYSPGTVCPSGYVSACSATAGGSSGWSQQFSLKSRETAVGCCPSGFGCAWDGGVQSCYSYASSGATAALATCQGGNTQQFSYATFPNGGTTVVQGSSTNVVNGMQSFTVQAPLVEIRWRKSDLPATATASTTSAGATASSTSSSTPTSDSGPSTDLSTGATVAIAVVIPVIVIAALIAGLLIWRRRSKSSAPNKNLPEMDADNSGMAKSGQFKDHRPPVGQNSPLLQEMGVDDTRHELSTEERRFELEGNKPEAEQAMR